MQHYWWKAVSIKRKGDQEKYLCLLHHHEVNIQVYYCTQGVIFLRKVPAIPDVERTILPRASYVATCITVRLGLVPTLGLANTVKISVKTVMETVFLFILLNNIQLIEEIPIPSFFQSLIQDQSRFYAKSEKPWKYQIQTRTKLLTADPSISDQSSRDLPILTLSPTGG